MIFSLLLTPAPSKVAHLKSCIGLETISFPFPAVKCDVIYTGTDVVVVRVATPCSDGVPQRRNYDLNLHRRENLESCETLRGFIFSRSLHVT